MEFRLYSTNRLFHPARTNQINFDPFCEDFQIYPHNFYRNLREISPVFFWSEGNAWVLTRYEDIISVIKDESYRSGLPAIPFPENTPKQGISFPSNSPLYFKPPILSKDRINRFILPFFSPEKINLIRREITAIVERQLSLLPNQFNLITEFSDRVAMRVLALILGIPNKYLLAFSQFCNSYLYIYYTGSQFNTEEVGDRRMHIDVGLVLIQQVIRDRLSARRREFLIDLVLDYKFRGEALSENEIFEFVLLLIVCCLEGMSLLICQLVYHAASRKKLLKLLRKHEELWDGAACETLRYDYFIKLGLPKYANQDSYLDNVKVSKGDRIYLLTASGLRDPNFINSPDLFDATRRQPELLERGYREYDYFGKNLVIATAEIAAARFFNAFTLPSVMQPTYESTHKTLRSISSLPVWPSH